MKKFNIPKAKVKAPWDLVGGRKAWVKEEDIINLPKIPTDKNAFKKEIRKTIKFGKKEIKEWEKFIKDLEEYLIKNK